MIDDKRKRAEGFNCCLETNGLSAHPSEVKKLGLTVKIDRLLFRRGIPTFPVTSYGLIST